MSEAVPHDRRLARAQADDPSAPALWLDLSAGKPGFKPLVDQAAEALLGIDA